MIGKRQQEQRADDRSFEKARIECAARHEERIRFVARARRMTIQALKTGHAQPKSMIANEIRGRHTYSPII